MGALSFFLSFGCSSPQRIAGVSKPSNTVVNLRKSLWRHQFFSQRFQAVKSFKSTPGKFALRYLTADSTLPLDLGCLTAVAMGVKL